MRNERPHQNLVRRWIPQGIRDLLNRWTGRSIYYRGRYENWPEAACAASGYDDTKLVERIKTAALSVHRGTAVWERDGIIFDHIPVNYPLLLSLSRIAQASGGRLTVLDFGGALGSTYHQCRAHLPELTDLHWHIIEQAPLVESGCRYFQTERLQFHLSLDECLATIQPDVTILSSVLQYLSDPYRLLLRICASDIPHLIIDRHPCSMAEELITIQVVPPHLYQADYPSWLFDCDRMIAQLLESHDLLLDWASEDPPIRGKRVGACFRGMLLRKRSES